MLNHLWVSFASALIAMETDNRQTQMKSRTVLVKMTKMYFSHISIIVFITLTLTSFDLSQSLTFNSHFTIFDDRRVFNFFFLIFYIFLLILKLNKSIFKNVKSSDKDYMCLSFSPSLSKPKKVIFFIDIIEKSKHI